MTEEREAAFRSHISSLEHQARSSVPVLSALTCTAVQPALATQSTDSLEH